MTSDNMTPFKTFSDSQEWEKSCRAIAQRAESNIVIRRSKNTVTAYIRDSIEIGKWSNISNDGVIYNQAQRNFKTT